MAILLTNDDGIDAPGLACLAEALSGLDDLSIAAPDDNRSGVGMSITLGRALRAKKHSDGPGGVPRYSIDGTPSDAAKFGLQHVLGNVPPKLVVSGINLGPNLGLNIRCSGTVGAAFEAVAAGVPALAVSVEYAATVNWAGVKYYARKMAEKILELPQPHEPFVLNLNVPSRDPKDIPGLVIARQGVGGVRDYLRVDPQDDDTYMLDADWIVVDSTGDCDAAAFKAGYAVLTPLRFEMTHDDMLASLCRQWKDEIERFQPLQPRG